MIFGWSYPAGAANDPNAPWNQEDWDSDICPQCGESYSQENLATLEAGDEPEFYPWCSQKCADAADEIERATEEAEAKYYREDSANL